MRPHVLRLLLGTVSLGVVALVFFWEERHTPAAALSAAHAAVPDLASAASCERCHGAGDTDMASACFECHEEVGRQRAGDQGFHATLAEPVSCGGCHSEHAGREFALVSEASFQRAGFSSRASFNHAGLGYELAGVHLELDCVECHELADAAWLGEGQRRFQGLEQGCESCHESPHEGAMERACVACHGERQPFDVLTEFVHSDDFPLEECHAGLECRECHEPGSGHSIEADAASLEPPAVRECAVCHEHGHSERLLAAAEGECLDCHALTHEEFGYAAFEFDAARHALSGFVLEAPHDLPACVQCHAGETFAARYPGRERRDCAACHEDPHDEQFSTGGARLDCVDCHLEQRFVPARFDLLEHAQCGFPLEGSHAAVACFACHEAPTEGPLSARTWRGLAADCAACHGDPHEGRFDAPELAALTLPDAAEGATGCARCHAPSGFAETLGDFDHAAWTGFALDGAHAEAECAACHGSGPRDEFGRAFGRIAARYGELPSAARPCVTCHADPHEQRFEAGELPRETEWGVGCARCHGTVAFDQLLAPEFEHERWTGVALRGAHADLECTACHLSSPRPAAEGRSFGRVRDAHEGDLAACATCHADPHDGIFDRHGAPRIAAGREGCARCHDQLEFAAVELESYFHDLWTGTDLRSRHGEEVGCDDCHPSLAAPGWHGRRRAPARGRTCVACHQDRHAGQFGLEDADRCARCHEPGTKFEESSFEHARDSDFVLDRQHVELECEECHRTYEFGDERTLVRYKPLGTRCIDCHGAALPELDGDVPQ